jgi:hypothetical protein
MSEEEISIKKIPVPIHGSDASLKATKYAIKAAMCEKARIICIYVLPAPENISEFEGTPFYSLQAYYDEVGKSAKLWFEKIIQASKGFAVSEDINHYNYGYCCRCFIHCRCCK